MGISFLLVTANKHRVENKKWPNSGEFGYDNDKVQGSPNQQFDTMSVCESEPVKSALRLIPNGELVNTVTHAVGSVLSIFGAVVLIREVAKTGDFWRIVGCCVFSLSMIAVYVASTLSHVAAESRMRGLFRTLDQGFIYLLIVGTYSAIAFTYLRTTGWWAFSGLMWSIAAVGFFSKLFFSHRVESVTVWSYVLLGWLPVIPTFYLIYMLPVPAISLLVGGGLCYTIGTVFLVLDNRQLHFHGIWHLLVIAGSTCHFFTILNFVA